MARRLSRNAKQRAFTEALIRHLAPDRASDIGSHLWGKAGNDLTEQELEERFELLLASGAERRNSDAPSWQRRGGDDWRVESLLRAVFGAKARRASEKDLGHLVRGMKDGVIHTTTALLNQVQSLSLNVTSVAEQHELQAGDLYPWLAALSLGLDLSETPLPRISRLTVYASNTDSQELLEASLRRLLDSLGLDIRLDPNAEYGSWRKKYTVVSRKNRTKQQIMDAAKMAVHGLELQQVEKYQAEANEKHSAALAVLLSACQDSDDVAVAMGSLLVVKSHGAVRAITLSSRQMIELEANPRWLDNPGGLLANLQQPEATTTDPERQLGPTVIDVDPPDQLN